MSDLPETLLVGNQAEGESALDAGPRVLALLSQVLAAQPLVSTFEPPWRMRHAAPENMRRNASRSLLAIEE